MELPSTASAGSRTLLGGVISISFVLYAGLIFFSHLFRFPFSVGKYRSPQFALPTAEF